MTRKLTSIALFLASSLVLAYAAYLMLTSCVSIKFQSVIFPENE